MTGRHPGHAVVRSNREVQPEGQAPMPEGTVTLARLLHDAGYATGGFQYWRLLVSGTNTSNVSVCELGLWTPKRTVGRGVRPAFKTQDEFREIRHETEYGVIHRYRLGVRRRHWTGTVTASQADLDDLRAWYRDAAAQAGPALWIPDSTVNDCYWVRLPAEGPEVTSQYPAYHEVALDLVEESGGGL
jgi:arylsulfatase A-like enzyme